MYQTRIKSRLKHWDFFLIDFICLELAFFLASFFILQLRNYRFHDIYRNEAIALILSLSLQAVMSAP